MALKQSHQWLLDSLYKRLDARYIPEPYSGCWLWTGCQTHGYGIIGHGRNHQILAHRVSYERRFGKLQEGINLDHRCRTTLCVNPEHLRPCNQTDNRANSRKSHRNKTGYKGVSYDHDRKKFCAHICKNGNQKNLGRFSTAIEAAKAYNVGAKSLFGQFALLNEIKYP